MEPESDIPLSFLAQPLVLVQVPIFWELGPLVAGAAFLLWCSAMITRTEMAFFSLSPRDIQSLQEQRSSVARKIQWFSEKPGILLATLLILNTLVHIATIVLLDQVLHVLIPDVVFQGWASGITGWFGQEASSSTSLPVVLRFTLSVISIAFLLLFFAEVLPKGYAHRNNIRLARWAAHPLWLFMQLFFPLSKILARFSNYIELRLEKQVRIAASREEIGEAIELTVSREQGAVREELNILHSIVKFSGVAVKQIMVSRMDIVAAENTLSYRELLDIARQSGYSRIPVYAEDLDNIIGILYVKDLLGHLNESDDFTWNSLIRNQVMYIPESKKIDDLLRDFQQQRLHMAIVVDEYGGTSGLVTLEDIMEEIIGDIKDEFDDESEVVYQKIDDFNYLFDGKTLLNDMCRIIGVPVEVFSGVKGEADSIAGLILELCGQFPRKDAVIPYNQFSFKIVAVSKRRIEQVRLTIHPEKS